MSTFQKAIQHFKNNELDKANQCIVPLLEQNPSASDLWHLYGIIAARQKHNHLAINSLNKACALSSNNGEYLFNLANVYRQAKMLERAIETYQKAKKVAKNKRSVNINYGIALKEKGLYDQALTVFQEILQEQADDVQAHINIGNIFTQMRHYAPAMAYYDKALQLHPKHEEAHRNKALLLLTQGKLKEGFEEYEWRWIKNGQYFERNLKPRLWDGTDLSGKHMFVWGEQGLGDEIMFASIFPELIQKARKVSIECAPRLLPIFNRSFPQAELVYTKSPTHDPFLFPDADFQSPSGSLMRFLRTSFDHFPKHKGFLKADPKKVKELNARYYVSDKKLKVGISWTSFRDYDHPAKLELWEPILTIPHIQFYNLQYGDCLAEIEEMEKKLNIKIIHDPDIDPLKSIDDQAAQIQTMDLVISTGNTTSQLVGALGKPIWVMLPISSDWHWFSNRDDSPWYPYMRFFRQPRLKDWESVVLHVSDALKKWISN